MQVQLLKCSYSLEYMYEKKAIYEYRVWVCIIVHDAWLLYV